MGLNSSGLLLQEEVRLVVEFCRGGGDWFWGGVGSLVGAWTVFELFVELQYS